MPLVVPIVVFDGVVSSYVVVCVVEIAIDFAALTLVAIVVSAGGIGSNSVKLRPSILSILGVTVVVAAKTKVLQN